MLTQILHDSGQELRAACISNQALNPTEDPRFFGLLVSAAGALDRMRTLEVPATTRTLDRVCTLEMPATTRALDRVCTLEARLWRHRNGGRNGQRHRRDCRY